MHQEASYINHNALVALIPLNIPLLKSHTRVKSFDILLIPIQIRAKALCASVCMSEFVQMSYLISQVEHTFTRSSQRLVYPQPALHS